MSLFCFVIARTFQSKWKRWTEWWWNEKFIALRSPPHFPPFRSFFHYFSLSLSFFSWLPQTNFRPPDYSSQRPIHPNHVLSNKMFLIERNDIVRASWLRRHQNIVKDEFSSWTEFMKMFPKRRTNHVMDVCEGPLMARLPEQQWTCRFDEGFKNSYLALFRSRWI